MCRWGYDSDTQIACAPSLRMYTQSSDVILFTADLSSEEKLIFFSRYDAEKKSVFWGYFWLLLTGFCHKFYLGEILWGILFLIILVISLALFLIPITLLVLWDLFFMKSKVEKFNKRLAERIKMNVLAIRAS